MILEKEDFDKELYALIVKASAMPPVDIIEALEGMKYQVYCHIENLRRERKAGYPKRIKHREREKKEQQVDI